MIILNIPFQGFYDSVHNAVIDYCEDQLFTDHATGCHNNEGLHTRFYNSCNYSAVYNKYAKAYTESFKDDFNIPSLEFIGRDLSGQYSFSTDKIECSISRADLRRIYKQADKVGLSKFVELHCTSRDGFWSYYSPDLKSWGYVDNWEYAQIALLVQFYFENHDNYNDDWEYETMQGYESNGYITQWLEESCPISDRLYKIHAYLESRKERE